MTTEKVVKYISPIIWDAEIHPDFTSPYYEWHTDDWISKK